MLFTAMGIYERTYSIIFILPQKPVFLSRKTQMCDRFVEKEYNALHYIDNT